MLASVHPLEADAACRSRQVQEQGMRGKHRSPAHGDPESRIERPYDAVTAAFEERAVLLDHARVRTGHLGAEVVFVRFGASDQHHGAAPGVRVRVPR